MTPLLKSAQLCKMHAIDRLEWDIRDRKTVQKSLKNKRAEIVSKQNRIKIKMKQYLVRNEYFYLYQLSIEKIFATEIPFCVF